MSFKEFEDIFVQIVRTKEVLKHLPLKYDEEQRNAQPGFVDGIIRKRQEEMETLQKDLARLQYLAMETEYYKRNGRAGGSIVPPDYYRGLL